MSTLEKLTMDHGRAQNTARSAGRPDLAGPTIEDRLFEALRRRRAVRDAEGERRPLISPPTRRHPYGRLNRPTLEDRLVSVWRRRKAR